MPAKKPGKLKLALESSVRKLTSPPWRGMQPEPGGASVSLWVRPNGRGAARSRRGVRPALPGEKSATYSIKGSTTEHGNPDPSAGRANPGKRPSPAKSRTGGGASVVVGARESRAQGEGRQGCVQP